MRALRTGPGSPGQIRAILDQDSCEHEAGPAYVTLRVPEPAPLSGLNTLSL